MNFYALLLVLVTMVMSSQLLWAQMRINPVKDLPGAQIFNIETMGIDEEYEAKFDEIDHEGELMKSQAEWEFGEGQEAVNLEQNFNQLINAEDVP